ncbi:MAG: SLBB domain-containing protein [Gemmatimonadota bacterium]
MTHVRSSARRTVALLGLVAALTLTAGPLAAQTGAGQQPPTGPGTQLQELIQQSGLTPAQIRQQLASRGYDPSVLDSYLDPTVQEPPAPRADELTALQALDIEFRPDTTAWSAPDRDLRPGADMAGPVLPDSSAFEREHDLRVYGLETFARGTSEFEPLATGPVPPGYIVGPGDELTLILTGDVEQAYTLPVTREGFVVIPQVGQVWVNGLTMRELRDRLHTELARAYSGIGRGPEATTHFEVTLGRLRSNQLFVTGEVLRPGSYLTSPVASVLNALYLAGGPRPNGSFRQVRVMRGGRPAAEIDLYAYLSLGDNVSDVVLQPGDVIFVPPHGPQVAVKGEVGRPAIYELREDDDLLDLLRFAGGLTAPAAVGQARITRILPPMERTEPGLDRTVIDVDLAAVIRGDAPAPALRDGDELRVFRVRPELRKVVTISGAVWKSCALPEFDRANGADDRAGADRAGADRAERGGRADSLDDPAGAADTLARDSLRALDRDSLRAPDRADRAAASACTFGYRPGMRAWDVIQAADGLTPDAYRQRAQIVRLDPSDSTLTAVPFSLETDASGAPVDNPVLEEHDAIRIFARSDFRDRLVVRVSGEVRDSSLEARYRDGLTLGDLLLEAGGLTPEADLVLEVSRRPDAAAREAGRVTETVEVLADPSYIVSDESARFFRGDWQLDRDRDLPSAHDFVLHPHDHVFVRKLPNIEEQRMVRLAGEVRYPGDYALRSKDERLSQLVTRAGGLTRTAFSGGFRLYRNGELVNVELDRVLEDPGSRADLILLPGDSMVVPEYNPVVLVRGAVNSPAAVLYREGADLDYYIASAGGYARHADRDNAYVRYANGQGAVPKTVLFFTRTPEPGPGSTVTVPMIPEDDRVRLMDVVGDVAQVLGTLGTALVILNRL